jgi:hypothetical protein
MTRASVHAALVAAQPASHSTPARQTRVASAAVTDERQLFESAVRAQPAFRHEELNRRDMAGSERLGEYVTYATEFAWRLWQARAALVAAPRDETNLGQWRNLDRRTGENAISPEPLPVRARPDPPLALVAAQPAQEEQKS